MANVLGKLFQDIADAIRSKTGNTATLKPNQFPTAIEGITTGGGGSSADVRYVTFRNESTGEEYKKPVAYGDDCVDVVAKGLWKTPTKESTAQYNYTFYGWGASDGGAADANILKNITEDKTVYAIFSSTVRYYTITWLDEDGTELPGQKQWAYGTVPSYTPTKDGAVFTGWNTNPVAVTGDATYIATWQEVIGGSLSSTMAWRLADGVLTISGTGTMPSTRPWDSYKNDITSVVVEPGATNLCYGFMSGASNVVSVEIPDTVTTIGGSAFDNCTRLQSLVIPDSVNTIDSNALQGCSNLKSVVIGSGITTLSSSTFYGCGKLESMTLPFLGDRPRNNYLEVPYYPLGYLFGESSFTGAAATSQKYVNSNSSSISRTYYIPTSLKSVTITGGCPSTGGFRNCVNLQSVTYGEGVPYVPQEGCYGCTKLNSVSIPTSATYIGISAFFNCTSLKSITIPSGIKTVYKNAFYGCSALISATFEVTDGWFAADAYNATSGTSVTYLANASNGALYLRETYVGKYLIRN